MPRPIVFDDLTVSVSSWATHRLLTEPGAAHVDLMDLPAELAARGFRRMELCHFHLPDREPGSLDAFKAALETSGVELYSLLIDDGDITHPEEGDQAVAWITEWVESAASLGATHARVIAGKQPYTEAAMALAIAGLSKIAARAEAVGVRLLTENWFDLLATPAAVQELRSALSGKIGLCLDFGNWDGPTKYQDFAEIALGMEDCHAKPHFLNAHEIDQNDYLPCLEVTRAVSYPGPYTLVDGSPGDIWEGLSLQREIIRAYLADAA